MSGRNPDGALASSFDFTAEDVALNAQGQLSERQEQMIASQQRRSGTFTIIAGGAMTASVVVVGAIALFSANRSGAAVGAFAAVAAVVVLLFAASTIAGRRKSADLRECRISTVTGTAKTRHKRTTSEHGGIDLYKLKIGKTKFSLANKAQLAAFTDGEPYTVHFINAPGTPLILSVARE